VSGIIRTGCELTKAGGIRLPAAMLQIIDDGFELR
jgi:hypothetical protein